MASTISGVTRIRNTIGRNGFAHLPPRRASATPAKPPSTIAMTVLPTATLSEFVDGLLQRLVVSRGRSTTSC